MKNSHNMLLILKRNPINKRRLKLSFQFILENFCINRYSINTSPRKNMTTHLRHFFRIKHCKRDLFLRIDLTPCQVHRLKSSNTKNINNIIPINVNIQTINKLFHNAGKRLLQRIMTRQKITSFMKRKTLIEAERAIIPHRPLNISEEF